MLHRCVSSLSKKYPTTVTTKVLPSDAKAESLRLSLAFHITYRAWKEQFKVLLIPTGHCATASAGYSRNLSNCTRLYLISSHSTARTCYRPRIRVPLASYRSAGGSSHLVALCENGRGEGEGAGRGLWRALKNWGTPARYGSSLSGY